MKRLWDKIPSEHKRTIVILLTILIVACAIYLLTPPPTEDKGKKNNETITHLLTDINTRDINMNNLSARLKQFEIDAERLDKQVEQLQLKLNALSQRNPSGRPTLLNENANNSDNKLSKYTSSESELFSTSSSQATKQISSELTREEESSQRDLEPENLDLFNPVNHKDINASDTLSDIFQGKEGSLMDVNQDLANLDALYSGFEHANDLENQHKYEKGHPNEGLFETLRMKGPSKISTNRSENQDLNPNKTINSLPLAHQNAKESRHIPLQIRTLVADKTPLDTKEAKKLNLVAGSIISGTLITGMDAPTHDMARKEPFPALLRIEKEAILPNQYSSDIRFCFLVMGGYGDLSSERAYLRAETLSCIFEDERVVETQLEAYAVGEDGKTGIRGRLVSKQGQLVAKSMMAGFLQGLAGAFDVNPVPSIQTSDIGSKPLYQNMMSQDALEGAALKGSAKALDRVAKFYLDMAQNMFPVIEIDASRQIEMIVTRGTQL